MRPMPTEPATTSPGERHAAGTGLGHASMTLGVVASVGSVFFLLLAMGMATESVGRSVESESDDAGPLLGVVGCVGAMLAMVEIAGLGLGLAALRRGLAARGPALTGVGLCGFWLVGFVVALLLRA